MKERTVFASTLLIVLVLSLGLAGLSQAQEPGGPEGGPPVAAPSAILVGTSFTYQGRLTDGGSPANGEYDFEFQLYDADSGGGQVGSTVSLEDVTVSHGLFSVDLDFGDVFKGAARWLQVGVRPGASSDAFTTLSPLQALTAAPYALSLRPGADIISSIAGDGVLYARNASAVDESSGLYGHASTTSGMTYGVYGESNSTSGRGVYGYATAITGYTSGVYGESDSTTGMGVYGKSSAASGLTFGVYGKSLSPIGMGVYGDGTYGVYGVSNNTSGTGVFGHASAAGGDTHGVYGKSSSTAGIGVRGLADASSGLTYGVSGSSQSTTGTGVAGYANASAGYTSGVFGQSSSTAGTGVYGHSSAASGYTYGVYGLNWSNIGTGVYGLASAASGPTYGVWGESESTSGIGVHGLASADSGATIGVYGQSDSTWGTGVYGSVAATSGSTEGVYGTSNSTSGKGVYGWASATSGTTYGVYGKSSSPNGYGGYFDGKVHVVGDLSATGVKPFKIDHPLDPANQYLYHYSIESSEVLNQYTGNVTLDENGEAWVELPEWFAAVNTDFRYQLTCIGSFAPVYIAQEIESSRFKIGGGELGMKVSWLVTALRNDPYMRQHPQPVEQKKPEDERGAYLYPELYGQPPEAGLDYQRNQELETPEPPGSE